MANEVVNHRSLCGLVLQAATLLPLRFPVQLKP
jgi:hypothetical protein